MKRDYTLSGLGISFLLHTGVLALFLTTGQFTPVPESATVIDFTIIAENAVAAAPAETLRKSAGTKPIKAPTVSAPLPAKISVQNRTEPEIVHPVSAQQETATPANIELAEAKAPSPSAWDEAKGGESDLRGIAAEAPASAVTGNEIPAQLLRVGKQATPGGTGSGATPAEVLQENPKNRYLKAHFEYIKNEIQQKIIYPLVARKNGWQGRVVVSFMVCEDGRVEAISVRESSGFALLDKSAVKTILQAAPFPPPPSRAELVVPINFSLV